MNRAIIIFAVVMVAAAFTLDCCAPCSPTEKLSEKAGERMAERMIEKATGEKVDIDIGGTEALKNMPSELVYPGAKKSEGSVSISEKGQEGFAWFYFETASSYTAVKGYYGNLTSRGWSQRQVVDMSTEEGKEIAQYTYEKGRQKAIITITNQGDKRQIAIWYGQEK